MYNLTILSVLQLRFFLKMPSFSASVPTIVGNGNSPFLTFVLFKLLRISIIPTRRVSREGEQAIGIRQ